MSKKLLIVFLVLGLIGCDQYSTKITNIGEFGGKKKQIGKQTP